MFLVIHKPKLDIEVHDYDYKYVLNDYSVTLFTMLLIIFFLLRLNMSVQKENNKATENCRICLVEKSEEPNFYLLDEQKNMMLKSILPNFIVLDSETFENEETCVSNVICNICLDHLKISYQFQQLVRKSEKRLWHTNKKRKFDNDEDDNNYSSKYGYEQPIPVSICIEPEVVLEPSLYSDFYSTPPTTNHASQKRGKTSNVDPISTEIGSHVVSGSLADLEAKRQIPLSDIKVDQIKGEDNKAVFLCPYCFKQFTRKDNAQRHVKEQHILKDNYGDFNLTDSVSTPNINDDIEAYHIRIMIGLDQKSIFVCNLCNKQFFQKGKAKRHYNEVHSKDLNHFEEFDSTSSNAVGLHGSIENDNIPVTCVLGDTGEDSNLLLEQSPKLMESDDIPVTCVLEETEEEVNPLLEQFSRITEAVDIPVTCILEETLDNSNEISEMNSSIVSENDPITIAKNDYIKSLREKRNEKLFWKECKLENLESIIHQGQEVVSCKLCKTTFTQESNALRHLKLKHFSSFNDSINMETTTGMKYDTNDFQVKLHPALLSDNKTKVFAESEELQQHLKKLGDNKFCCSICHVTFTKKYNGIRHLKHKHFNV